jgi:hypothetical protein
MLTRRWINVNRSLNQRFLWTDVNTINVNRSLNQRLLWTDVNTSLDQCEQINESKFSFEPTITPIISTRRIQLHPNEWLFLTGEETRRIFSWSLEFKLQLKTIPKRQFYSTFLFRNTTAPSRAGDVSTFHRIVIPTWEERSRDRNWNCSIEGR